MNANDTIFALALASNFQPKQHLTWAIQQLACLGALELSHVYQIPCRDGVGEDYLNCACILRCHLSSQDLQDLLKDLEQHTGRVRPSHKISLDIDLIAWGKQLSELQLNQKKMPFAPDVKIPMYELIASDDFSYTEMVNYPKIRLPLESIDCAIAAS